MVKSDVLTVSQVAGVMAAKRTADYLPLCHPLGLRHVGVTLSLRAPDMVDIESTVACEGPTGVEMEALTAVATAALNVYDMCKPVCKDMTIENIRLLRKSGGKSGDYVRE